MRTHNILYFTDNTIYLKSKKQEKIIKYKVGKNILAGGKIINPEKFIKTYEKLLNEYHLNNTLFGENIKIIINPTYTMTDIIILKNIFNNFNYRKILIDNETKYYKLNKSNAYLNVLDTYSILTYQDEFKKTRSIYIPENFFLNEKDIMPYLKYHINNKSLFLIGKGNLLNEIFNNFEKIFGNKTFLYSDSENYLIMGANSKLNRYNVE